MAGHDALVTAIRRATAEKNGRLGEGGRAEDHQNGTVLRRGGESGVAACEEPFVGLAGVFLRLTETLIAGKYVD